MISGRRRSVIFFTLLGICLVALAVTLNISWIVLNWYRGVLVVLGFVLFIVTFIVLSIAKLMLTRLKRAEGE